VKRGFDIAASLCALLLLSPILAAVAVAVWMEDFRSPFYCGQRVARGGGDFRMVKFRTMIPDAWKSGVNSTSATDSRITRIGRALRGTKIDELPQLWNVLIGDMSLVGPRPQVRADANLYTDEERRMLGVRPGITDLASIVFADEGEILSESKDPDLLYNQIIRPWKSRLILLYLDNRTLRTDLRIVALTLLAAMNRERALAGVVALLGAWRADQQLLNIARRDGPLPSAPPPGSDEVVTNYPDLLVAAK
jgi:lipopolysaccharide/colanic/teichoic acid biosynthesis glycosyltransferase